MGLPSDDPVIIRAPEKAGDPSVITISCPDKTGLGCDLCRVILFFGLSIVRGGETVSSSFYSSIFIERCDFDVFSSRVSEVSVVSFFYFPFVCCNVVCE